MGRKTKTKRRRRSLASHFLTMLGLSSILAVLAVGFLSLGLIKLPQPCANSISCVKDLSGRYEPGIAGVFMGSKIQPPPYLAHNLAASNVLGGTSIPKHIFVDLTNQKLYAYEGQKQVFDFPVATGKWRPTPTGDFKIWIKLRYTRMTGGSGDDYYDLPNVPYVMFFASDTVPRSSGFSIHGAYWHNNFGYPMSHGCVNMRPEDAAKIYDWVSPATDGNTTYATDTDPGTQVTIFGQAPE